ncbi:hypothetical protein N7455_010885 [Penicillium solitum]|uniref:uncharacterized protein n=1 Tax=Penicillium solitum TaxID=60172 RepID=UPI0032C47AD7|nr:hypothetical protein N7455_010885 [Penicillium solitum]
MLNALPYEIVLLIAESLPTDRDVSALTRTTRAFYDLLVTYLYKRNMRSKYPALFWCCRNGLMTPVKHDESLPEFGDTLFDVREAERSEDTRDYQAVVKLLLDHGANPNNTTTGSPSWISPLMVAARCGNLETAKILLEHGASPSLHYAAYTDGYGSRLDEWQSPLKMACYLDSPEREPMIDLLLQYGAEINLENEVVNYLNINYETPLHLCQSSEAMVKVLLENGGQVDVPNSIGHTPLFYHDDVPAMKQLLAHGADLNVCDYIGYRPVTNFISSGNYDAVKLLLNHGADPNYDLLYGETNLHVAAMNGHADILELLLENAAHLGIAADDGSTVWDVAKDKECREVLARWERGENEENHLSDRKDTDAIDEISDGPDDSPEY